MGIDGAFGIDLGTTNSCIAQFDGEEVQVFRNDDQMSVTPSVVRIEKSGRIIVGRRAYATKLENPENVAGEFKRWMGQRDRIKFGASGRELSAEELSAEVLKSLVHDVHKQAGVNVQSAVVTVPAAFGQLQCEATARAGALAGIETCILLQEPIAAAVAYGLSPNSRNQRWLVFDFGGGTFDVAVVSSRDGYLTVLEHKGDNLLGGKDIDKTIVDNLILPHLREEYNLPAPSKVSFRRLMQKLLLKAEEAKMDLSRGESTVISLFDIGTDDDSTQIETELELNLETLQNLCAPIFDKSLDLCFEALKGARTKASDLDRVLLVGGPTQMPSLRALLERRLEVPIDFSQDPMTVVAKGAAIYAQSADLPKATPKSGVVKADPGEVVIKLAYEAVSADLQCTIEGKVENDAVAEVKIDAESGYWSSGWTPLVEGFFEVDARLLEGKSTRFAISARDAVGKSLPVADAAFVIRHGLSVSAPPLPHSISAEVTRADGTAELDVIFNRGTALPCFTTRSYSANTTLRPSEPGSLAIKLWEGEVLADPDANDWVGCMLIESHELTRVLPEGSQIELTIAVDTSRLLTVEAYVPRLDLHVRQNIYKPERDEKHFVELAQTLPSQIKQQFRKLDELEKAVDDRKAGEVQALRTQLEELDVSLGTSAEIQVKDPEEAKRLVEEGKKARAKISELELGMDSSSKNRLRDAQHDSDIMLAQSLVDEAGTAREKLELKTIMDEFERCRRRNDDRGLTRIGAQVDEFTRRILFRQPWFLTQVYEHLMENPRLKNHPRTGELCKQIDNDMAAEKWDKVRNSMADLRRLLPDDEADAAAEKVMRAGIRRTV